MINFVLLVDIIGLGGAADGYEVEHTSKLQFHADVPNPL